MFYRPEAGHGLPHNPWNAIVAPRPIAWVSTRGGQGTDNLAPYSFFNAVAYVPPQVMFASTTGEPGRGKDTVRQVAETGVFCINIATVAQAEAVNATSASFPAGTSEFEACAVPSAPCETIDCLRVADAAASIECRAGRILPLAGTGNWLILGVVTGIHLRDDCLVDGVFDMRPVGGWLSRLGHNDYAAVDSLFQLIRP